MKKKTQKRPKPTKLPFTVVLYKGNKSAVRN